MSTLHQLLMPQVILGVISRIQKGRGRLQKLWGMQVGGPNVRQIEGRYATFRIFDHTRAISEARNPGSPPATVSRNPIGQVQVRLARFHEKIVLSGEELGNLSPLAGPNAKVDEAGQDYISRQEGYLAEKINNTIEFMVAGMLRGAFYYSIQSGDRLVPFLNDPGGNRMVIDFQIPPGNKGQLNMLGTGNIIGTSWDNPAAPIIQNLYDIDAALQALTGRPLAHVVVNNNTWTKIITNTEVRLVAGSSVTPFETFEKTEEKDSWGNKSGDYAFLLRAANMYKFHVMNHVLVEGGTDPSYSSGTGTRVKVVPDNSAFFFPEPDSDIARRVEGSELIVENYGSQKFVKKSGLSVWSSWNTQPSGIEIISLLNSLPILETPQAIAHGTVVF